MTDLAIHPAIAALPRPAGPADLLAALEAMGIAQTTVEHRAIFTVEEGADIKASMPGGHTKNLFLKDKNGALALVSALGETRIPVNKLNKALAAHGLDFQRFSFAKEDVLWDALGVRPGSVTAFALVNDPVTDRGGRVTMVLDKALLDHAIVNFHPLENTATTSIAPDDLLTFVRDCGHEPAIMDIAAEPAD